MFLKLFLVAIVLGSGNVSPVGHTQVIVQELPEVRATIDATGFQGTVLVYSFGEESYFAAHGERVDRQLIPASTFKILNSLIALEVGVILDERTVIPWDGVTRQRKELNRDLELQTAFRLSAVPHFQALARRVGAERMKQYVDAVGYGNCDISGKIDEFWLKGDLKISPREQIQFLTRLYQDELPFSHRTMAIVKKMMISEETSEYTIRSKTGWATLAQKKNVGWWVGWVERKSQIHFFATVLEAKEPGDSFGPSRQSVTRSMLKKLGVIEPVR